MAEEKKQNKKINRNKKGLKKSLSLDSLFSKKKLREDFKEDLMMPTKKLSRGQKYTEEDEEPLENEEGLTDEQRQAFNEELIKDELINESVVQESLPAEKRGVDPQKRAVDPKVQASQTPDSRVATEYDQTTGQRVKPAKSADRKTPADGQASADRRKSQATEELKDQAKEKAGEVAKTGAKKVAETTAKTAKEGAKLAKAAVKVGMQVGRAVVAFLIANWYWILGGILIIALLVGLGAGISKLFGGGARGGTISQPADPSNPAVKEAIERLATLAGDENIRRIASAKELEESGLLEWLEKLEDEIEGKPNAQTIISGPLANAKTLAQEILGGANDVEVKLQSLFKNLDEIINLALGVNVDSAKAIADKAIATASQAGSWTGTTNDDKSNTQKPLRDGSNVVGGKRGCDASGFISYLVRGDNSNCILCITPNAKDLPSAYSSFLKPSRVAEDFQLDSLLDGDIIITTKVINGETNYGVFVFSNSQKKVYYCSSQNGPTSADESVLLEDGRQLSQILRFNRPKIDSSSETNNEN